MKSKSLLMENKSTRKWFLLLLPLLVLLISKLGGLLSIGLFPLQTSWIGAFLAYYIAIVIGFYLARRYFGISLRDFFSTQFKIRVKPWQFVIAIVLPAFLPITAFITQIDKVPTEFIFYIFIFAMINPWFEEAFWRGLLSHLPISDRWAIFYSALGFSFSHYFLWSYWLKSPMILIPTLVSTFIMGLLWMWFVRREKNILYPVVSHAVVDVLNLSVAVYAGLINFGHIS